MQQENRHHDDATPEPQSSSFEHLDDERDTEDDESPAGVHGAGTG